MGCLTQIINKYHYKGAYTYIGRGSPFGNPFSHMENTTAKYKVATREEAVLKYKDYFYDRINKDLVFKAQVESLRGGIVGCFCRPIDGFKGRLMCHGQIIAGYLDDIKPEEVE